MHGTFVHNDFIVTHFTSLNLKKNHFTYITSVPSTSLHFTSLHFTYLHSIANSILLLVKIFQKVLFFRGRTTVKLQVIGFQL